MKALEIEVAVMQYFGVRKNIIVPNVWWGMGMEHEADLIVLTKSNCAYEIEIKVSKSDLKQDLKKEHLHFDKRISRLYFAIPEDLLACFDLIPPDAGILLVYQTNKGYAIAKEREAKIHNNRKFSDSDRIKLAELGSMRILGLKQKLLKAGK